MAWEDSPCCDWCGIILPGCTPVSHHCEDTPHECAGPESREAE